jgi:uncharacterized protein
MKTTTNLDLDPESFGGEDFPSDPKDGIFPAIISKEDEQFIKELYENNPHLKNKQSPDVLRASNAVRLNKYHFFEGSNEFHEGMDWIQTYSGKRFTPTAPIPGAIVIQDIAHSLSMQCRFTGHVERFYSVAQHSVMVSYICDMKDAKWGLLHDASEAYLIDVPRPLKRSGNFDAYLDYEKTMQKAVCQRFFLSEEEPESVKRADKILLATEARDLMGPLHPDWHVDDKPLAFTIEPASPQEAKIMFMKRFCELFELPGDYREYLHYRHDMYHV